MNRTSVFPREEYVDRARRVEAALEQAGYDALVGYSVKNAPGPVAYLGGYEPSLGLHDIAFFTVVPGGVTRCTLLTNASWDHPQKRTWVDEVIITSDFGDKLASVLPRSSRRIGIAGYRFFPTEVYKALQAAFPSACIQDATPLLLEIASVKSSGEIDAIRQCITITEAGVRAFLASVREGVSEREVQADVDRAVVLAGADAFSFRTQVYSGPQVAVGIGFQKDRVLVLGEQVQLDVGAVYRGYRGDLSRVTTIGHPSVAVRAIMETTAQMCEAMLRAVRPGVMIAEVAEVALSTARAAGMESYLYRSPNHGVGFVGHGIGCWYHEPPEISLTAKGTLEANMVIVLEPILGCQGLGGAKIEDPVVVTPHGALRLSTLELRTWPE
jgi:Xaa-Pro aminopeptidase